MLPSSSPSFCACHSSSLSSSPFRTTILFIFRPQSSLLLILSYLLSSLSYLTTATCCYRPAPRGYSLGAVLSCSRLRLGWSLLPGFWLGGEYLEVGRTFGFWNSSGELLEALLLLEVVFAVIMKRAQLILEQSLRLVQPQDALFVELPLLVELPRFIFFPGLGAGGLLAAQPLAVERLLLEVIGIGDVVPGHYHLLLLWLQVLVRIEKVAAEEGRIEVLRIGFAVLVGTVEGGVEVPLAGLLVEVNGPASWTFRGFSRLQVPLARASVHSGCYNNSITPSCYSSARQQRQHHAFSQLEIAKFAVLAPGTAAFVLWQRSPPAH